MKLTTRLHLVSRLRMSGGIPLLPPISLHGMDKDNFTFSVAAAATTMLLLLLFLLFNDTVILLIRLCGFK